jgi:outer membrane protein assembly factor BamB
MTTPPFEQRIGKRPLRLWPGVIAVVVQWLSWFVLPFLIPKAALYCFLAGAIAALATIVWWLFFSRAPWLERIGALVLMVVAVVATKRIVDPSIAGGMMGMMLPVFAMPVMSLALVLWAATTRRLATGLRRAMFIVAILLGCVLFTLVRTGGLSGTGASDFHWRWTKTPEQLLLAQSSQESSTSNSPSSASATESGAQAGLSWLGFRGANRDSIVHGVRIETDWAKRPPVEMWRRKIGPGWSSFAVQDNLLYTQEQRGDNEVVSCYNLNTGQPVWQHNDATRFYESNAGAGPRGTPTLNNGRVYTFGGTGILNALDARSGSVVWSRNAATDTTTNVPHWGFASSPLVAGDVVIVAAAGTLAAYDLATGKLHWSVPGNGGYSSPQLSTIGGIAQVLLMNGQGVISVAPTDGKVLWKHEWAGDAIVQPATTADGDVLMGSGSGMAQVGVVRLAVVHDQTGWAPKERWKSYELNPYYNDFVVHKNFAFGLDNSELSCIDLNNGQSKWRGGNYGGGQLILLADQDLLLLVSEKGELALVRAAPDQFTELARFKAIEGKTWNHPVLVGNILLVRNGEEMAAFRLTPAPI